MNIQNRSRTRLFTTSLAVTTLLSGVAFADDEPAPTTAEATPEAAPAPSVAAPVPAVPAEVPTTREERGEPVNSININPLGVIGLNYAVTYERLFAGSHGLIVEGIATLASGDDGDSQQFGGGIGYRWHWRGRQNSGFLGIMVSQGFGSGEVVISDGAGEMKHGMTVRSTTITGNIGKRWLFGPVNVTIRGGLGYGKYVAKAKEDTQEAKDAEELMNDILAFLPIAVDGELSIGYTF